MLRMNANFALVHAFGPYYLLVGAHGSNDGLFQFVFFCLKEFVAYLPRNMMILKTNRDLTNTSS